MENFPSLQCPSWTILRMRFSKSNSLRFRLRGFRTSSFLFPHGDFSFPPNGMEVHRCIHPFRHPRCLLASAGGARRGVNCWVAEAGGGRLNARTRQKVTPCERVQYRLPANLRCSKMHANVM